MPACAAVYLYGSETLLFFSLAASIERCVCVYQLAFSFFPLLPPLASGARRSLLPTSPWLLGARMTDFSVFFTTPDGEMGQRTFQKDEPNVVSLLVKSSVSPFFVFFGLGEKIEFWRRVVPPNCYSRLVKLIQDSSPTNVIVKPVLRRSTNERYHSGPWLVVRIS